MNAPPDNYVYWKNRRRMAWLSLLALIAGGAWCISHEVGQFSASVLSAIAWSLAVVIFSYIGGATWADVAQVTTWKKQ